MKTKTIPLVALLLFNVLSQNLILAASDENNDSVAITVGDYCNFLNAVAADDPHHLYDEQFGVDSAAPCIQRSGTLGYYTYVVTSGDQDKSVLSVDRLSAMRYCNWLENSAATSTCNLNSKMDLSILAEHGVYEFQNDQVVAMNSGAAYFVADDNEPLSLSSCYDEQLRSSRNDFHLVNAPSIDTKKNSKPGSGATPWKTIEGAAVGLAVVLGGGGEEVTEQASGRETRESLPPALNANSANSADITPRQMMNPSTAEEGAESLKQILGRDKTTLANGSIERGVSTVEIIPTRIGRNDISQFTNEKPKLLGGGPKPDPTKKSSKEKREGKADDSLPSMEEARRIEKQFKDAITTYPDAPRLIVKEGEIVPPDPNVISNNNDRENQDIMRLLKNVIIARYSLATANGIPELSPLAFVSSKALSSAKIREILQRYDDSIQGEGSGLKPSEAIAEEEASWTDVIWSLVFGEPSTLESHLLDGKTKEEDKTREKSSTNLSSNNKTIKPSEAIAEKEEASWTDVIWSLVFGEPSTLESHLLDGKTKEEDKTREKSSTNLSSNNKTITDFTTSSSQQQKLNSTPNAPSTIAVIPIEDRMGIPLPQASCEKTWYNSAESCEACSKSVVKKGCCIIAYATCPVCCPAIDLIAFSIVGFCVEFPRCCFAERFVPDNYICCKGYPQREVDDTFSKYLPSNLYRNWLSYVGTECLIKEVTKKTQEECFQSFCTSFCPRLANPPTYSTYSPAASDFLKQTVNNMQASNQAQYREQQYMQQRSEQRIQTLQYNIQQRQQQQQTRQFTRQFK